MTDPTPERRLGVGARVAVLAVLGAALVLGGAIELAATATVGVLAAGLLAVGTRTLAGETNRDRAKGSVSLVAGSLAICGAIAGSLQGSPADTLLIGTLSFGVTAVVMDALIEDPIEASADVGSVVSRSGVVLGLGVPVALVVYTGAPLAETSKILERTAELSTYSAFVSLLVLQLLAVSALVSVLIALRVLDEWRPEGNDGGPNLLGRVGDHPFVLPEKVWGLLGAQLLVATVNPDAGWFAAVLDSTAQLGDAIGVLLAYGVFHLPLLVVTLLACGVVLARGIQIVFVWWAGRNPPETLAYATGGVLGVVVGIVASAFLPASWLLGDALGLDSVTEFGVGSVGLAVVIGALVSFRVFLFGLQILSAAKAIPSPTGYGAGAVLLFLASMGAGGVGATPLAVFVGVAAAVLVWDLGRNATVLREQLGRNVETRDAERTHATASVLVGGVTVGLATGATYVLGPGAFAPADPGRAMTALVLAVVAILAFAVLVER